MWTPSRTGIGAAIPRVAIPVRRTSTTRAAAPCQASTPKRTDSRIVEPSTWFHPGDHILDPIAQRLQRARVLRKSRAVALGGFNPHPLVSVRERWIPATPLLPRAGNSRIGRLTPRTGSQSTDSRPRCLTSRSTEHDRRALEGNRNPEERQLESVRGQSQGHMQTSIFDAQLNSAPRLLLQTGRKAPC